MDYVHKIASPQTYACSLCSITYGNLGMHRQWASYLRGLPLKLGFSMRIPAQTSRGTETSGRIRGG